MVLRILLPVFVLLQTTFGMAEPISRAEQLVNKLRNPDAGVMVVAHRACWASEHPENSLPAISACIALGVDMIEIDVALSADGIPVLMHDKTLDRTTNASGAINQYSLKQLRTLRLKTKTGGKSAELTDSHIPTLKEALLLAKDKILINLDIKGQSYDEVFEVVDEVGLGTQILMKMRAWPHSKQLIEAPFLGKTLFMPISGECNALKPAKPCSKKLSQIIKQYQLIDTVAYEVLFTDMSYLREGADDIKGAKKRLWVNTLSPHHAAGLIDELALDKPDKVWGSLIDSGVNIIQTDYPESLKDYLRAVK